MGILCRIARTSRPLWCHARRGIGSGRDLPIHSRRSRAVSPWDEFFSEPLWGRWRPDREFNQLWKMMDNMMTPRTFDAYYVRPRWGRLAEEIERASEVAQVKYDQTGFEVKLDVKSFEPSELQVKLAGNRLSVHGKHETKQDEHGTVSREFSREFTIPEDVNLETLHSSLSEEGYLTIRANIIEAEKPPEKTIDITMETKKPEDK